MKALWKKHRELLWFSLFLLLSALYFLVQLPDFDYHIIHVVLDDKIPFLPAFVIPYVTWYVYVPGMLLYLYGTNRALYRRTFFTLFCGAFVSLIVFCVYPTAVDLRPDAAGPGFFRWVCRIIYASDQPVNVCPSLHCYESLLLHLMCFRHTPLSRKTGQRVASAVTVTLICLSTVCIKQHSVLDLAVGCALAVVVYSVSVWLEKRQSSAQSSEKPASF